MNLMFNKQYYIYNIKSYTIIFALTVKEKIMFIVFVQSYTNR